MAEKKDGTDIDKLLAVLDEAIAKGPWDKSNFLKVIGRKLQKIRDELSAVAEVREFESRKKHISIVEKGKHLKKIYISLYSSQGNDIKSWERLIDNLPMQYASRPIYEKEEHVKEFIKTKPQKINEGYVEAFIDENLILARSERASDKLNNPLLSLKSRAILLENIHHFKHISGEYEYSDGHLKKIFNAG